MRVLLAVPYQDIEPYILPNLGLGYLASALRNKGHEVTYLDCLKEKINALKWKRFLREGNYDVIGIQMYSYAYNFVKNMLRIAKDNSPGIINIVGGPHANAVPDGTMLDNPEIDYVVHGEGERSFPELVDALERNNLNNISNITNVAWRSNGNIRVNKKSFIEDLDNVSPPAWNLMEPRTYPILSHGLLNRAHPIASIFATRGCPYSCVFCSAQANMGSKIRKRAPSKIVDEIELLVKGYGVREIHFEDDNFTFDKDFASSVCQGIIDRKIKIFWSCPNGVRIDSLDTELLRLMERSGCYSFALGIESGSDKVLSMMKKGISSEQIRRTIHLIAENTKIRMTGFFIFGFPGEEENDLRKTEKLILSEPLHRISAGQLSPYPGTQIFKRLIEEKLIPEKYNWGLLSSYGHNIIAEGLISKKRLSRFIRLIHLRFYFRPRVIIGILSEIHSFRQFKAALRMLLYWLGIYR